MVLHRFIITPLSPWITHLRSDTLNGLLASRIAEDEGEEAVRQCLDAFLSGQEPFAVSSAMPAGFLPMPKLPPMPREAFRRAHAAGAFGAGSLPDALQALKKFRKKKWLPWKAWQKYRHALSLQALFTEYCGDPSLFDPAFASATAFVPHVSIDRQAGRAADGALYASEERFFSRKASFHLYARTDDPQKLEGWLARIGDFGFGRDAGTGKGRFAIERDASWIDEDKGGPARLMLSAFAVPEYAGLEGWYSMEARIGKAGPIQGPNPFKSPYLSVLEGSVLLNMPDAPAVLKGLHANPQVLQLLPPVWLGCTPT